MVDDIIPHARRELKDKLRQAREHAMEHGRPCDSVLVEGSGADVADVVTRECARWDADLAVVGTHARRGLDRVLLGSVAENILRHCAVPVLMVRAQGMRQSAASGATAGAGRS
jgi:nucleotide-binding universal stress UspA family protein